MIRFSSLFLIVLVVSGCSLFVKNPPVESDLIGDWVSTGFVPYAELRYPEQGKDLLVFSAREKEDTELFEISNFAAEKAHFTITLTKIGSNDEPEKISGFILEDQLQLLEVEDVKDDGFGIWFVRSKVIDTLKINAEKAITNYESTKHNHSFKPM